MTTRGIRHYWKRVDNDPTFRAMRAERARIARRKRGLQKPGPRGKPLAMRLLAKMIPEPNSGCWIWLGAINGPYGWLGRGGKRGGNFLAHRASYEIFIGEIPEDYDIHHKCEVKLCINPDHLIAITREEHMRIHSQNGVYK